MKLKLFSEATKKLIKLVQKVLLLKTLVMLMKNKINDIINNLILRLK